MNVEPIAEAYPPSPMQEGMLFHSLSARQPGVDIEQILCTLREAIDSAVFERAWQHMVERHAILRTSFRWDGLDAPQQEVHSRVRLHFENKDWRGWSEDDQQTRFETFLQTERARGFDLTVPPLMRLVLCRTGKTEYRLIWTFHHLLLDGRAVVVLLNEVFAQYEALDRGEELELAPPRPYRDYIDWLQQRDWSRAERFWREYLKGFKAATPLVVSRIFGDSPQDRLAPTYVGDYEDARGEQHTELCEAVTAALKTIARENNLTLNTMVQGAWALLLSRYSGEEDVVFGAVRACRRSTVEGAESIVGLLINTVPLRVKVPADSPLLTWLAELRNAWVTLRDHEHTPLVKIQAWSDLPPGTHSGLFESIFNFQDPSWDAALRAQGGKWSSREFDIRSQSNYPLAVDAYGGSALVIKVLYQRARFEDETITRLLGHLRTLLEGMAENPARRLCQFPLLTQAERQQTLIEWNDTAAEFPQDKCVHQLFEEQARRTPDALAVADDQGQRSYRELDQEAEGLAQELRGLGVGPEARVGVCIERSAEMVAALLAVLKAGAAYVPLDPAYPPERLAFMLADAKAPVLLTQQSLLEKFKSQTPNLKLLCVDNGDHGSHIAHHASRISPCAPQPSHLAYVIYTSGSTGQPKGVEIQHAGVVNLLAWHQRVYQVTPADRATQLASPAFDAAVWEMWPYLTCGASVHIPDEETRLSPKQLLQWITAKKITLAFIPTPLAEAMFDEAWPEHSSLRALLTGGDRLHRPPPEKLPCALFNHYGPTENTVVTTWIEVLPGPAAAGAPPIGRPIANTQVYLLDRKLQPVPIGVPGELHVAGVGLARGYLNRPDLTAEKFVPNPFSPNPRSRLYKTGDLARYLPNGSLEFLGRGDQQVKVRGHRIELGEIEAALSRHESVHEVAVAALEDKPGQARLVAYVVPSNPRSSGREEAPAQKSETSQSLLTSAATQGLAYELRRFLRQKLPDYMTPSAFVFLGALPLTPNGKVDCKALPAPEPSADLERTFVSARTPTERALSAIWCEVLGLPRAGIHDNFFELGGHSLLATQVVSRVRGVCQVELPIAEIFAAPTIAALAKRIEECRVPRVEGSGPDVQHQQSGARGSTLDNSSLSFAQERLWFLEQMEPGQPFNNIPLALRLEGRLDVGALQRAFNDIVSRHKPLRTAFDKANGRPVAVTTSARPIQFPVMDLTGLPQSQREPEAERLSREEAQQPFDLTQSPLLRVKLARLSENEHLLLLTTHHIACDGWSLGVFYRELAALYEAYTIGSLSPLPELPMDYACFARWQKDRLQDSILENQLAYWKQQLSGAQTTLDLPTDRPRPSVQTYRGALQHFALPSRLAAALKALAREEDATLFMLSLAAFQTLLHRYTGQQDILVGSSTAGRTRVETEGLIGLFLNTLVLRGDLSGDPPFRELIRRVRQVALDAYAHQDLPFEKLVEALGLPRDLSCSPVFQVMFILQNEPLRPLDLAGLKLTPRFTHSGTAKFDLTLSLEEIEDGLAGYVEFNSDLFDQATIVRMLGHYQTLLEAVVADAGQRVSALPLLTESERKQVLVEWNDTRADFATDICVHQLFEQQARRNPEAIAVVFEEEQLTYRELNERADELALELEGLGVGPEVRVGICVERSLEILIGLLGILKAGGCYVPLDPRFPRERLAFMLQDSQASVLLTQDKLQFHLKFEIPNLKLVSLDAPRFASRLTPHPDENQERAMRLTPERGLAAKAKAAEDSRTPKPGGHLEAAARTDAECVKRDQKSKIKNQKSSTLAYVIYTSGSTGQPKGVMVTHRNVVNFFAGMDRLLGTQPGVWLAVTSISFDISVLELFWTLARGFKVVIQRDGGAAGETPASTIPQQIVRHGVTHLQCTPSLAKALVLTPEALRALRQLNHLLVGGEALPVALAEQLSAVVSSGLLNMYGPTETTVWSAAHRLGESTQFVPIGRPIANTQIYVLDNQFQPVPAGVPGEIFIGGEGVARGYLKRPGLTAEKFVPKPAALELAGDGHSMSGTATPTTPQRLYRTGDRGRWLADGNLEFLGRLDNQVKIRGHRIELGEIESVLGRHPAVRQMVVTVREDTPGDQRLVAYIVAVSGAQPAPGELRCFAKENLPEAMVPSAFVFLDALPLTPNGKADRRALPAPDSRRPGLETAYVAPRNGMEQSVARIWQELLQVEQVGRHDNFFDLGGHSLLVVQAQARLRDNLGLDLPVVKLFQYPTVSALAGFLSEGRQTHPNRVQAAQERARRKRESLSRGGRAKEEVAA